MKHEQVIFQFKDVTPYKHKLIESRFNSLVIEIREAMEKAGRKTTNPLQHTILGNIHERVTDYVTLSRDGDTYSITLASDILRAFDVKLPINGIQTTAVHLSRRIGENFMRELNPKVRYKKVVI